MATQGVIASMQPYHVDRRWPLGRQAARHRGSATATSSAPCSMPEAHLVFGSDWTVAPIDPILGIYAAVTRRTLDGKNPGGWIPEQKISVEEALRAYTATMPTACSPKRPAASSGQATAPTSCCSIRTSSPSRRRRSRRRGSGRRSRAAGWSTRPISRPKLGAEPPCWRNGWFAGIIGGAIALHVGQPCDRVFGRSACS